MLHHPNIDPVALSIGPLKVHWYGIMYLFGFASALGLGIWRSRRPGALLNAKQVEDLVFYGAMGVVLGGRLGYVFFYNFSEFVQHPLWLFRVWEGGMSFHGGLIGVALALGIFARKFHLNYLDIMDFSAPLVPLGLFFGRMGNFINGELWGRASDLPWAMIFQNDPDQLPRHPSQLYEAFFEGIVIFAVLWWFSSKPRPRAAVCSLFLILYSVFRFCLEFVRQPDAQIQFDMFGWVTRGQELCLPMFIVGLIFFVGAYRVAAKSNTSKSSVAEKTAQ